MGANNKVYARSILPIYPAIAIAEYDSEFPLLRDITPRQYYKAEYTEQGSFPPVESIHNGGGIERINSLYDYGGISFETDLSKIIYLAFGIEGISSFDMRKNILNLSLTWLLSEGGCDYVPGDVNGNGTPNVVDVTYFVNYLKGTGLYPPDSCDCPPLEYPFYGACDVNGNCGVNIVDVTFFVNYLRGVVPELLHCENCPPAGGGIMPGDGKGSIQIVPRKAKLMTSNSR